MGIEDRIAGRVKQARGKGNQVAGAARGNSKQELKGKIQRGIGKIQESLAGGGRKRNR